MPCKTIVSMGCITAIVITAILSGVDGWLVFSTCSLIAGLGGYALGRAARH